MVWLPDEDDNPRSVWPAPFRAMVGLNYRRSRGQLGVTYCYQLACGHSYYAEHKVDGAVEVPCGDCAQEEHKAAVKLLETLDE